MTGGAGLGGVGSGGAAVAFGARGASVRGASVRGAGIGLAEATGSKTGSGVISGGGWTTSTGVSVLSCFAGRGALVFTSAGAEASDRAVSGVTGASDSGVSVTGASESGVFVTDATDSGASVTGATDSGASVTGASDSRDSLTGASDSGASVTGASDSGVSETGVAVSGASEAGMSDGSGASGTTGSAVPFSRASVASAARGADVSTGAKVSTGADDTVPPRGSSATGAVCSTVLGSVLMTVSTPPAGVVGRRLCGSIAVNTVLTVVPSDSVVSTTKPGWGNVVDAKKLASALAAWNGNVLSTLIPEGNGMLPEKCVMGAAAC
mmetsp:Transcript_17541/g.52640  ORF Transcript_17541/g.52640 Transcript_17541/m.52640 type:complete len:323 (+) Transcript_17541:779-1747(+)